MLNSIIISHKFNIYAIITSFNFIFVKNLMIFFYKKEKTLGNFTVIRDFDRILEDAVPGFRRRLQRPRGYFGLKSYLRCSTVFRGNTLWKRARAALCLKESGQQCRVWMLVNSFRPSVPNSVPIPDCLTPPKGALG